MGLPEQGQKRMMARKDFVAVHFPTLYQEWGVRLRVGDVSSDYLMTELKKNNPQQQNLMRRRTLKFPTTKSSCGTR